MAYYVESNGPYPCLSQTGLSRVRNALKVHRSSLPAEALPQAGVSFRHRGLVTNIYTSCTKQTHDKQLVSCVGQIYFVNENKRLS
jgi:hypothetical protein